jgi:hypothetical protein
MICVDELPFSDGVAVIVVVVVFVSVVGWMG